jgi:hypothetical protein
LGALEDAIRKYLLLKSTSLPCIGTLKPKKKLSRPAALLWLTLILQMGTYLMFKGVQYSRAHFKHRTSISHLTTTPIL